MKPTPKGISEQEVRAFRGSLRLLVRKIGRQLRDEVQCCGVGYLMSHILLELEQRGASSLKDLQEALEIDKAALSRSVDYLVKDKLVTRKDNPADRRSVILALTAAGSRRVAELNAYTDEKYRRLFSLIPPNEHATVLCAVDYLARAFDELCGDSTYCPPEEKSCRS